MHDWARGFLVGTVLGLASGMLLGTLFAPEKGRKTRRQLVRRGEKLTHRAGDVIDSASDFVGKGRKRIGL